MSAANEANASNDVSLASPSMDTPIIDVEDNSPTQSGIDWNDPPLFKPKKVRVKEYWEVISLVAPCVDASNEWSTKMKLTWSLQNPKSVQRHMKKYHSDILAKSRKRKEAATTQAVKTLDHFYNKKLKRDLLPASKADQAKGEALLVKWIAESLRPFTVVEDKGFRDFVHFLCNLHKEFSVPGRIKVRNQLVSFGTLVREKMKEKIKRDVKYCLHFMH